jgi:hypothetical protein
LPGWSSQTRRAPECRPLSMRCRTTQGQATGAGVVRQAHRRIPAGGSVVTPSTSTILARPRCPATSRTAERETLSHSAIALITARLAAPAVGGLVTQASSVWPSHRSLDRLDRGWARTMSLTTTAPAYRRQLLALDADASRWPQAMARPTGQCWRRSAVSPFGYRSLSTYGRSRVRRSLSRRPGTARRPVVALR